MNSYAARTPGQVGLAEVGSSQQTADLRIRFLGAGALIFVVVASFATRPAPGGHGTSLGVAIALTAFCVATIGVILLTEARPAVLLPLLLTVVVASATLIELQHNGTGILGVFLAVSAAALRLPVRLGAIVVGAALAAVTLAGIGARWPLAGATLDVFGVVAFYLLSMFARQLRVSNGRNERLLDELEQTRAAQTQAAALGERQRLAREMHDVLAHSLSGLVLNLEGARLLADRGEGDPEVSDAIERALRLAKTGLQEARGAIGMLRDEALPGPERLEGLASDFEVDTGVECALRVRGNERDMDTDARLTLYRVAQEALTNIRKHSRPERVELLLSYEPTGTRLTVEDYEGSGERPPPGHGSGYGLTGMRERAELMGGSLTAGSTEAGFRVELWVPA